MLDLSGHVLILPQGGLPDQAPEGAVTLEGGKVYVRLNQAWNVLSMTAIPTEPIVVVHDAKVAGAGSVGCNGDYVNQTPDEWKKPNATFFISRVSNYPEVGVSSWVIRQDERFFYMAPDDEDPWNKTWSTASFGTLPVPTVVKV